jgi:nuclear pore complex protein Nup160
MDKTPGGDGSAWKDTFYNAGGWTQGLRSLIPFQGSNTIRYGRLNFELSAVTSIAMGPSVTIRGMPYVFTVSLDHQLRVWNLATGRIEYAGDLLDQDRSTNDTGKYVIHPSLSQLVRVSQDDEDNVFVTTYSPIGAGHFKFWQVTPADDGDLALVDIFPDLDLVPPPPTSDVWTLADFAAPVYSDDRNTCLWVLWKNNLSYRTQKVDLTLTSARKTADAWSNQWSAVAIETLADAPLPLLLPSDSADSTEKWLKYILFPGRFTLTTIETALSIYERGLGGSKATGSRSNRNLAEKMCSLVASTATMDRNANGHMEYEHFRSAADAQWRRFYRLVVELDKLRGEAMSLSFDHEYEILWVATSDGLCTVRDCSAVELEWHTLENSFRPEVSRLLTAASVFRDAFSDSLLHSCNTVLSSELFQDPSATDPARIRSFYDKCNLGGQIADEDYTQLVSNLGGDFKILSNGVYDALFETMSSQEEFPERLVRLPLAATGRKAAIRGVQELAELHHSICFDQLMLLVFVESEVDQEEEGFQLEASNIYRKLLISLRRLELLRWLSQVSVTVPLSRTDRISSTKDKSPSTTKRAEDAKTTTLLEACVGHLLDLVTHSGFSAARLFTETMIGLVDAESDYELEPAMIQSFLLVNDRPDLALELARFCLQDPFSVYVQGRVALAVKDLATSASYFKKAAFEMGTLLKYLFLYVS